MAVEQGGYSACIKTLDSMKGWLPSGGVASAMQAEYGLALSTPIFKTPFYSCRHHLLSWRCLNSYVVCIGQALMRL